jgi:hypothetical protein
MLNTYKGAKSSSFYFVDSGNLLNQFISQAIRNAYMHSKEVTSTGMAHCSTLKPAVDTLLNNSAASEGVAAALRTIMLYIGNIIDRYGGRHVHDPFFLECLPSKHKFLPHVCFCLAFMSVLCEMELISICICTCIRTHVQIM